MLPTAISMQYGLLWYHHIFVLEKKELAFRLCNIIQLMLYHVNMWELVCWMTDIDYSQHLMRPTHHNNVPNEFLNGL